MTALNECDAVNFQGRFRVFLRSFLKATSHCLRGDQRANACSAQLHVQYWYNVTLADMGVFCIFYKLLIIAVMTVNVGSS